MSLKNRAVKLLSDACFGFFVIGALLLTVIAITYQPPDPWLEPGSGGAGKRMFDNVETNATFQTAGSLLVTGEDVPSAVPSIVGEAAISESDAEAEARKAKNNCSSSAEAIDCSDPGVLAAIEKANLAKFPEIDAFEYKTPVRGGEETTCDVAWRFKPKKEKSTRRYYRDYRRYTISREEASCEYVVTDVGDLHSGKNARSQVFFHHGNAGNGNTTTVVGIDRSFRKGRYLYYTRGGDYCKGMSQFMWSFMCALGEARYLNRTLVVDKEFCISGRDYGGVDQPGKDLRFYLDLEHLRESAAVIDKADFLDKWAKWNRGHRRDGISTKTITDNVKTSPMELKSEPSTIIERDFAGAKEPDSYWYRVCEGETENVIQRPWDLVWKSRRLMNIVNTICGKMEWDFDAVRVVRGEKAENKKLWPNLDSDTTPEALLRKLSGKIDVQRYVYISTNERRPGYFDRLKSRYYVSVLDDYKELWGPGSEWYNDTMVLTGGKTVEFDVYMRDIVDSEMFFRAKKRIETFGELTSDCKDGINTC